MMKWFFFLVCVANIISAQSGFVEYAVNVHQLVESKNSESQVMLDKMVEYANKQKFQLKFSSEGSSFKIMEDMSGVNDYEKQMIKIARIAKTSRFDIYYDKKNQIEYSDTGEGVLLKEEALIKNWEITAESKIIDDYLCYKAIYNRVYIGRFGNAGVEVIVAWFAPILPYIYGPKDYYGLPGLILELADSKTTYVATKIELSDKEIKMDFPKGKTISRVEYDKKLESSLGGVLIGKKREKEANKQ